MLYLARGFAERGFDVELVLTKLEGSYISEVPRIIKVVDFKAQRVLASLPALVRYLRRAHPAALLSAMDHSNIVALWAKRLAAVRTRVVVSVHNPLSIKTKRSNGRKRLIPWIARWCYGWADEIVAVSRGVAEDLSTTIDLPGERIRVIYNPVVVPELFELAKQPVEHPWFCAGSRPVVLSAGRLTAQKDYPTLVRAFSQAIKSHPMRLIILGDGEERARLEAMVRDLDLKDVVSLPGFVKNPYAYMSKATMFVLSSIWEGFGNVLVEAIAVGTPVISTDCPGGPGEILEGGKWGRLVPVGDVEALASAMKLTLNDLMPPDVSLRAKDFGADAAVEHYLRILEPDG